jgi:ribosomal protein S18 acetylase RimI-like enzyme
VAGLLDTSPLGLVRRFEAAGFRAWPAASVHYDGTWVIRLTAGHTAKRLNSVNPLDPGDARDIGERIGRAGRRFEAYGRPLVFRMSPLAGTALEAHLDERSWARFSESLVMAMPLTDEAVGTVMDQIPLKDMNRFVTAAISVHGSDPAIRPGLSENIGSIEPATGLFVMEAGELPAASGICVQDGELAGLFEIATAPGQRRRGHGRRLVLSALKWAKLRGATVAWLQVEANNDAAIRLYRELGFREAYRYHYRRPREG